MQTTSTDYWLLLYKYLPECIALLLQYVRTTFRTKGFTLLKTQVQLKASHFDIS
jgi:hypothetical protein